MNENQLKFLLHDTESSLVKLTFDCGECVNIINESQITVSLYVTKT